jgi:hypothetical protein
LTGANYESIMTATDGGVVGNNDPPTTFRFSNTPFVGEDRILR